MKWPAERLKSQSEKSFGIYEAAAKLEASGVDVIHLAVGRPSFDTPLHIKQATKQALDDGIVHYCDLQGEPGLRQALTRKLREYNHIEVEPNEILITNGLTQASFATFMATLNEGDEAIVFHFANLGTERHVGGPGICWKYGPNLPVKKRRLS